MAGVALQIDLRQVGGLADRMAKAAQALGNRVVLEALLSEGVSQTQRRIDEEKTDSRGKPWKPWSTRYAKTRRSRHSLLVNEGHLMTSIRDQPLSDTTGEWGSPLIYAAAMHVDRPYLGLSRSNARDMDTLLVDMMEDALNE